MNDTELSFDLWSIKKTNHHTPYVTWEFLRKYQPNNPIPNGCSLWLNEKLKIAMYKGHNLCLHRKKTFL